MKLVMTLLVRDEEDIIRENIEYHLAQGVDFIIATDNLSVDATPDILREYESGGLLHYIHEADDDYNQHAWVTRMARMACTDFGADWVINNDADEFWWPATGDLKQTFAALPKEVNVLRAGRHNFVATGPDSEPFHARMTFREAESRNALGQPLPPKVAHRAIPDVFVAQGNHSVSGFEAEHAAEGLIEILHFPIRSYRQIENKISKGGAAYERNRELSPKVGKTWRDLYAQWVEEKNLAGYFSRNFYDEAQLAQGLDAGVLIADPRLKHFFLDRL